MEEIISYYQGRKTSSYGRESCGKEAFEMLSDYKKRIFHLFIWAGCGCHKDLNTVKGGYMAMSEWWNENGHDGPVPLANHDNDPVIQEWNETVEKGDTTTPAQDRAYEKTTKGAIKTAQIAGAIFNHKDDDKQGHHDLFDGGGLSMLEFLSHFLILQIIAFSPIVMHQLLLFSMALNSLNSLKI